MAKLRGSCIRIILVFVFIPVFFAMSAFAMYCCINYTPGPFPAATRPDIIIEVVTVDCGKFSGTFKTAASEYSGKNRQTRFFVIPVPRAQIQDYTTYDLLLSFENDKLYAFITTQDITKKDACRAFSELLSRSYELPLTF